MDFSKMEGFDDLSDTFTWLKAEGIPRLRTGESWECESWWNLMSHVEFLARHLQHQSWVEPLFFRALMAGVDGFNQFIYSQDIPEVIQAAESRQLSPAEYWMKHTPAGEWQTYLQSYVGLPYQGRDRRLETIFGQDILLDGDRRKRVIEFVEALSMATANYVVSARRVNRGEPIETNLDAFTMYVEYRFPGDLEYQRRWREELYRVASAL